MNNDVFSPFDLASYTQPGHYLTCCMSYTCCLLGRHTVELDGPGKVKPVSVTLNYTMAGDHLEKNSHPSVEFNTIAQARSYFTVLNWGQFSKDVCEVISGHTNSDNHKRGTLVL